MTGQQPAFYHPASRAYRFTVLLFVAFVAIGSYFAYDSTGAIATTLVEELGLSRADIGATYTVYSIAALMTVFAGGLLVDRIGIRKASLLFSCLLVLGAIIVALAPNKWVLLAGRFIFGAGCESLYVAQNAMIARWFKGKELALAFGLSLTISRLGTIFSFNTEELIAKHFGNYSYALWAAVLFCLVSLGANLVYNFLDLRGERQLKLEEGGGSDKIVFGDIKNFGRSYWFVTLLCVTFYSAVFPFTALSTDFFADKWHIARSVTVEGGFFVQAFANLFGLFSTAGGITSIIMFASMFLAPFAGTLVDRLGRRASLMVLGSLLIVPAHLLMGLSSISPIGPMLLLGAAFVLVPAAMWPSIPLLVKKEHVGTAYGLTAMIQNVGLALFPLLNGWLRDSTQTYTASLLMFASLGFCGLIFALLLLRADRLAGGALEKGGTTA